MTAKILNFIDEPKCSRQGSHPRQNNNNNKKKKRKQKHDKYKYNYRIQFLLFL